MNTKSVFEVVSMPHRLLSPPPPPTPIHHIVESPLAFVFRISVLCNWQFAPYFSTREQRRKCSVQPNSHSAFPSQCRIVFLNERSDLCNNTETPSGDGLGCIGFPSQLCLYFLCSVSLCSGPVV